MHSTKHPLYKTWEGMKARCNNSNHSTYPQYGGRGISICDAWKDFHNFVADMGEKPSPKHTLDRIDSNGNYCPENCRWATRKEQCDNRRPKSAQKGAKGIHQRPDGKWVAQAQKNWKKVYLGAFDCPMCAHIAYKNFISNLLNSASGWTTSIKTT